MTLVGLYFIVSVVNNFAFYFDIPLPLHMIFRAVREITGYTLPEYYLWCTLPASLIALNSYITNVTLEEITEILHCSND